MAYRRRAPGAAAVLRARQEKQNFDQAGQKLAEENLQHIQQQISEFKSKLEAFAIAHKNDIKRDPAFRSQFQEMCATIGVDPLASNKGFWSELLGVGDFYFELAVQVIEICIATRDQNGGLIDLQTLHQLLKKRRGPHLQAVSEDDVRRALEKVKILGNGFKLYAVSGRTLVVSVPRELNSDQTAILALAEETNGVVSKSVVMQRLNWTKSRCEEALHLLLTEGMAWVDDQTTDKERAYYITSIWMSKRSVE